MAFKTFAFAAAVAGALVAGSAGAVPLTDGFTTGFTVGLTDAQGGNRDLVLGTDDRRGVKTLDLGTIEAGDTLGLYGRVVSTADIFTFTFATQGAFTIDLDLDGYRIDPDADGVADGTVTRSGLVTQGFAEGGAAADGKLVQFILTDGNGASLTRGRWTELTAGDPGALLFWGLGRGDYTLVVKGYRHTPALYDLRISAVPLPASVMMLLGALGGFALIGRRRRAAMA